MNNEWHHFSLKLTQLLSAFGKSQKDLSHQTDISESKLSKLLSGKVEPRYKDILTISDSLNVSPSFFFDTRNTSSPAEIGYILGTRIYSVIFNNPDQDTLILMGRTIEENTFTPIKSLGFLADMKNRTVFTLTLISGEIIIGEKVIRKGIPFMLYRDTEINFKIGSCYILQIVGEIEMFTELMKNHLPPEKTISF